MWPADTGVGVYIGNYGNFDTRTLPRMKDAVLTPVGSVSFPIYTSTNYTTEATVNEVIEFMAKEVAALGWQEYVPQLSSNRLLAGQPEFPQAGHALGDLRPQGSGKAGQDGSEL